VPTIFQKNAKAGQDKQIFASIGIAAPAGGSQEAAFGQGLSFRNP
jgi:hypothetical protein